MALLPLPVYAPPRPPRVHESSADAPLQLADHPRYLVPVDLTVFNALFEGFDALDLFGDHFQLVFAPGLVASDAAIDAPPCPTAPIAHGGDAGQGLVCAPSRVYRQVVLNIMADPIHSLPLRLILGGL